MKYQKVIIFSLGVIVISTALYYVISKIASSRVEQTILQTQTITVGPVTYKVTPKKVVSNSDTWDFEVSLDTHTGSLDQDLVALVRLVDDKGNKYKAIKWEGTPPGGHHREGVLSFNAISPKPNNVSLIVKGGEDL